jgi:5-methyltetrahydropteroyltriglutamate--homocysteine methyltransferase
MRKAAVGVPHDDATFRTDLAEAVTEVVKHQTEVGIDVPSDGEFGKRGWIQYVTERLNGLEYKPAQRPAYAKVIYADYKKFGGFYDRYKELEESMWLPPAHAPLPPAPTTQHAWVNTGKVTYKGRAAIDRDISNFKSALKNVSVVEAFMPSVAPSSVETIPAGGFYKSSEEYVFAVAEALSHEYRAIVEAGFILQIDDAILPMHYDPNSNLEDYLKWASVRVEATNHALKDIPRDKVRYHMCWGSQNVPHTWDIPLKDIIHLLFTLKVGALSLEAANPRHEHEWQLWETVKLPDDLIIIPGMISHSTNVVEHPELIAWRLGLFAQLVGRERVIAGTDCGFSQNWNLIRTHEQVQWAKLEALAEGARLASKKLWVRAA